MNPYDDSACSIRKKGSFFADVTVCLLMSSVPLVGLTRNLRDCLVSEVDSVMPCFYIYVLKRSTMVCCSFLIVG